MNKKEADSHQWSQNPVGQTTDQEPDVFDPQLKRLSADFCEVDLNSLDDHYFLPWNADEYKQRSYATMPTLIFNSNNKSDWRVISPAETAVVIFISTHLHGWCVLGSLVDFAFENKKHDFQYQIMRLPSQHPLVQKLIVTDGFAKVGEIYSDYKKLFGAVDIIAGVVSIKNASEESSHLGGHILVPIQKIIKGKDSLSQAAIIRAAAEMSIDVRQEILADFF